MFILMLFLALSLAACGRQDSSQSSSDTATESISITPQPSDTQSSGDPLATLLAATVPAATTVAVNEPEVTILDEPILRPTVEPTVESTAESTGDATITSVAGEELVLVPTKTPEATAIPEGRVLAALVNVRSAPALSADVVGTLDGGKRLQILDRSDDGDWLRVCCSANGEGENETGPDVEQWVDARYLEVERTAQAEKPADAGNSQADLASNQGLVNANLINLRQGPSTAFPTIGQATDGQILDVMGRSDGSDWLQVCCASDVDRTPAWVSAEFITVAADVAIADLAVVASPPTPEAPQAVGGIAPSAPAAAPGLPGDGGFSVSGGTNPLTGLPLAAGRQGVRPIIVCINNDYAARPQYGTSQADVMYEYIMEGFGITRFSGVFLGESVEQIGPVRSARLINYYLGALYNGGLACSGASDGVRYILKHQAPFPYMDVDLDDGSNTRYSISLGSDYRTRLRTSIDKLRRWLSDWGVEEPARLRGFTFGGIAADGLPATSIVIPYPSATGSQAAFVYDAGLGAYLRSMGGAPHLDGNTGAQIAVENVVVQYVPHEATDIVEDSLGSTSIRLNLFGSGRSVVFHDGKAYPGTWRSESRGDTPRFYTDGGAEVPLKPGKTWISVVPTDYAVNYQ